MGKKDSFKLQEYPKTYFDFGLPLFDMTEENFMNHPDWDVYTFGRPPVAIDIMLAVKGLDFDQAYKNSIFSLENGISIRTLSKEDLIKTKTASMRPKDIDDLANI